LIVVGIAAVIVFLNIYVDDWLNLHQLMDAAFHKAGPAKHHGGGGRDHGWDLAMIAIIALVLGVSTSITAIQKWQADKQLNQELEQDRVTSELSFLKAQINPHFFFNTLNNIYALTQVDADVAGKAIHQLSRMMRYLLYDTQQGQTMLSQEIAFVKDYISLMQLRLTDVVKVNIDTPVNLQDVPLAPMLFLPFVENAFKHGVSATQQSHIDIVVLQRGKVLDLTVKNSIINDNSISLDTNSGIGLVNTRRRLDLLYPGKYKLDIEELNANNEYIVHLTLDLS
jgi:LytS/YehU family sensor histidine kinase